MSDNEINLRENVRQQSNFIYNVLEHLDYKSMEIFETMLLADNIQVILADEEMVKTAKCFFDNNLNITIAAKKLYMHRNTLVYRLEKMKKILGLDIKEFDDAITLKILITLYDIKRNKDYNKNINCVL